jgi:hypothetical protein
MIVTLHRSGDPRVEDEVAREAHDPRHGSLSSVSGERHRDLTRAALAAVRLLVLARRRLRLFRLLLVSLGMGNPDTGASNADDGDPSRQIRRTFALNKSRPSAFALASPRAQAARHLACASESVCPARAPQNGASALRTNTASASPAIPAPPRRRCVRVVPAWSRPRGTNVVLVANAAPDRTASRSLRTGTHGGGGRFNLD